MLDSEPGNNNSLITPDEAPKRPRRRAASRPAGPPTPVSQTAETPVEQPDTQPEQPASGEAAEQPVKKTAARKTAAKKSAAKKTAAKKSTPRKAAARKTASEAPADDDSAAVQTAADEPVATAADDPVETAAVEAAAVEAAAVDTTAENTGLDAAPAKKTAARKTAAKKTASRTAAKRTTRKASPQPAVGETPEQADLIQATEAAEQTEPTEPVGTVEPAATLEPAALTEEAEQPASEPSIEEAIESALNATLAEREQGEREQGEREQGHDDTAQVAESAALEGEAPEVAVTPTEATADEALEAERGEAEPAEDSESQDEADEGGGRRRRRRRGGRRRRRGRDRDGSGDDDSDDTDDSADDTADDTAEAATDSAEQPAQLPATDDSANADQQNHDDETADEDSDGESGDGQRRRRRRRRRRRGEDTAGSPDDPTEVVVRVREPRKASDEVTGIDGSTRMEAKRQRRREGREAGRRRAPIISEAEFLARRESVNRKMVIRQRDDLSQIAVLEDGILVEHYVDRESANSLIGNVYLGRVQNVLPSMEAAFIDIGRGRNAVLYAGEVDWDSYGAEGHDRKVENVLKSGQTVLVQVTKDPVGAKGARLTNHVSIPGRYVVYAPGGHLSGISRKLPENERKRLKDILDAAVDDSATVIVRTAAEGASEDELTRDVNRLKAQWEDIERKVKSGNAPQLLYAEPDLTLRIVRDLFTEDFSELIVQGNGAMNDAYDALGAYMGHVAPHLVDRIRRWNAEQDGDLFGNYRLDEQIAKGLERKVFLPSGGSLIIDRTEAMTVIDVNTGKFTGSGGNLEATITANNLEAAEEIVRQLRLRDIGGIIVIDFIDMVLPSNRELLLRRLVECLGRDRTRHQVAEVTSLGLVQMTRKRIGTGLLEAFSTECPHCHGRGVELHDMPVADAKMADGGARDEHNSRSGRRRGGGKNRKKNADDAPAEVPAAS